MQSTDQVPIKIDKKTLFICLAWPLLALLLSARLNVPGLWYAPSLLFLFLLVLCASSFLQQRFFYLTSRWLPFGLSLIAIIGIAFLGMMYYFNYSNFDQGDIGCYLSAFWNQHHGVPGMNALWGKPILAMHSEFFIIPVSWLFQLWPTAQWLLIMQTGIVFFAWILLRKWLVRSLPDPVSAEWLALGFVCLPAIIVPLLKGFHGITLALPFLVLVGTAFADRRFKKFAVSLFFLLLIKETFVLTACALAAVAIITRRGKKWWLFPLCAGLSYGVFLKLVYFPFVLKDTVYYYVYLLPSVKETMGRLVSPESLQYLCWVITCGGSSLVCFGPLALVAVPCAVVNMLLQGGFSQVQYHYILEPTFWAFFGMIAVMARKPFCPPSTMRLIALSTVLTLVLFSGHWRHGLPSRAQHPYKSSYAAALTHIRQGFTVSLGAPLAGRLWKSRSVRWMVYDTTALWKTSDQMIVQKTNDPPWCLPDEFTQVQLRTDWFRTNSDFVPVFEDMQVVVFERKKR